MRSVLFKLPAVIYTIAVIALNIILRTFSPLWYAWTILLWFGNSNCGVYSCLYVNCPETANEIKSEKDSVIHKRLPRTEGISNFRNV